MFGCTHHLQWEVIRGRLWLRGSQANTGYVDHKQILRHHEAHRTYGLLHIGNIKEKHSLHRNNAPTTTSVDHRHKKALNN